MITPKGLIVKYYRVFGQLMAVNNLSVGLSKILCACESCLSIAQMFWQIRQQDIHSVLSYKQLV